MDSITCRAGVRQAVVTAQGMMALRRELQCDENGAGAVVVATKAKDLPKETFHRKILVANHEKGRQLAAELMSGLEEHKSRYPRENLVIVSANKQLPPPRSPSAKGLPLSSLKEIFLPQLEVDQRHHGRVLVGTLCVQPFTLSSVLSVLADKSGKAVRIAVYNWAEGGEDAGARFCAGTKVAIKEPFFKHCVDGKFMVRVDDPADLVFDDDSDEQTVVDLEGVIQDLDSIRAEGNRLVAQQNWSGAIEQYSDCIARCGTVVGGAENEKVKECLLLAYSNRSEVWLKMQNFKNALDDANRALEFDANHQKSISRRDRAWQGFGKVQVPAAKDMAAAAEQSPEGELSGSESKDGSECKSTNGRPPSASREKLDNSGEDHESGDRVPDKIDSCPIDPPDSTTGVPASAPSKSKRTDSTQSKSTGASSKVKAGERTSASPPAKRLEKKRSKGRDDIPAPAKGKFVDRKVDALTAPKGKRASKYSNRKRSARSVTSEDPSSNSDDKDEPSPPGTSNANGTVTDDDASGSTARDATSVDPKSESPSPPPSPSPLSWEESFPDTRGDSSSPPRPSNRKVDGTTSDPSLISGSSKESAAATKRDSSSPTRGPKKKGIEATSDSALPPRSSTKAVAETRRDSSSPARPSKKKLVDSMSDSSPPGRRSSKGKVVETRSASPSSRGSQEAPAAAAAQNEDDSESPNFAAWLEGVRASGDALLAQGKWVDAICRYDSVTEFSPTKRNRDKVIRTLLLAYSQRSEAWMCLGNYDKSLGDADTALEFFHIYAQNVTGYEGLYLTNEIRRGRAFHALAEYEQASSIFAAALTKSPDNASIADFLRRSTVCCQQSREGIYDLDEYFLGGCKGPPPFCSDFIGPVEIRRARGKGRGLFVTKDVEAGDLLFVSNPLTVVCRRLSRANGEEDYSLLATKWRRHGSVVGLDDFVGRLALLQSERKMYQLYALSTGNLEEDAEIPAMDAFVPGTHFQLPRGWESPGTNLSRVRAVVKLNAIDGGLNPLASGDAEDGGGIGCVGLWALPSFMNHSCAPNCHMVDVGNAMFVRASRPVREGEELTRAYFDVYQNGVYRQSLCQDWLFQCQCERCDLELQLITQRVLPVHEYCDLLSRAREETLKRSQTAGKERSLSLLLPNPQPAALQLRKFADWFDRVLGQVDGLGNREKAWMGASHLEAYVARFAGSRDKKQVILALETMLEFMTNTAVLTVSQAEESALRRAAQLLDMVEGMYGKGSQTHNRIEMRVLHLYATVYGRHQVDVVRTLSRIMVRSLDESSYAPQVASPHVASPQISFRTAHDFGPRGYPSLHSVTS